MSHAGSMATSKPMYGRSGLSDARLADLLAHAQNRNPEGYVEFCKTTERRYDVDPDGPDFLQGYLLTHHYELGSDGRRDVYIDLHDFHARRQLQNIIDNETVENSHDYGTARNGLSADFGRFASQAKKSRLRQLCLSYESQNEERLRNLGWRLLSSGSYRAMRRRPSAGAANWPWPQG